MATAALKYTDILSDIDKKKFAPLYFLWGDEEYYIDLISEAFEEKVLEASQKDFDFSMFYGQDIKKKECDLNTIIASAKRYPMLSPYQLIIVREAQYIDKWDALEAYIKQPVSSTILVFCYKYKKIDKRKSVFKQIEKAGVLYESVRLKDSQFASWISSYIKHHNLGISDRALALLSESLENNLKLTSNELNKLVLNIPQGREITEEDIEKYIGINKEYNIFGLTKALSEGNIVLVRKTINYMKRHLKEQPLMLIIPQLYRYFSRVLMIHALINKNASSSEIASTLGVPPFFLHEYMNCAKRYTYSKTAQIISLLKTSDLKSKGVNGSSDDAAGILEDVIYLITH